MKHLSTFFAIAAISLAACTKELPAVPAAKQGTPMIFRTSDDGLETSFGTKAVSETTQSNISSIYVSASTGTGGSSETAFTNLANKQVNLTAGTGSSDVFWPATGSMNFYASSWNVSKSITASGCTSAINYAGGTYDYAAGSASDQANGTTPIQITLKHVLSRLYDLKLKTSAESATATILSISVTPAYTNGTYNYRTDSWTGCTTAGSQIGITPSVTTITSTSTSVGQSAVDRTFIPGNVTISVRYKVTRTGYSKEFTKSATVNLPKGQKSTVTGTLSDDASGISFKVSVTDWTTGTVNGTFS